MKRRLLSMSLAFALSMGLMAGCGVEKAEESTAGWEPAKQQNSEPVEASGEAVDPMAKYEDAVSFTMCKPDIPDNKLPNGDTIEDNEYLRYIKEQLNVEITYDWIAQSDMYNQKLALSMANKSLPDVIFVPNEEILKKLVEAELVEDLTQAYADYASPTLREYYDSIPDGKALETPTYNGKLMALPDLNVQANCYSMLWLRSDWLEALGLPEPKTMDDVLAIAKAFVEKDPDGNGKDDTVAFTGGETLYGINMIDVFNPIFASKNSFPGNWIKNDAGEVVYGSIQPETKEALAVLRQMYADGLIDPEFATKDPWNDNQAMRVSGKSGMYFAPWWVTWGLTDTIVNNQDADWRAYLAPVNEEGKVVSTMQPINNAFIAVRKGYEHPEAVVKVLNLQQECIVGKNADYMERIWPIYNNADLGYTVSWNNWPFNLSIDYADAVEKRALVIDDVIAGKKTIDDCDEVTKGWYNCTVAEEEAPKQDGNNWAHYVVTRNAALVLANTEIEKVYNEYYGVTKTMETKGATLGKMESEVFLKIIMGKEPLEAFDTFVEEWKSLGGDEITEEVRSEIS